MIESLKTFQNHSTIQIIKSTDLSYIMNSFAANKPSSVPRHHPSLIMQDAQTDTTHHLSCGCCGGACIQENAWWSKKDKEMKTSRPVLKSSLSSMSVHGTSGDEY